MPKIMTRKKHLKCLFLFSGGLDSILGIEILRIQKNIKIVGLTFKSIFFDEILAKKMAKKISLSLKIVDISSDILKIVKKPKYGYGKGMNPCLDCRILMLKKAKEILKKERFDFIASGEVLGERPMTQNKFALNFVEKKSSLKEILLRPLSAKLLKETIFEKKGLIKRELLLDISGRSRKRQISLAKKFNLKNYPTPSGGCILTDINFSKKLKDLLNYYPQAKENDINLLKIGRHFWENKVKIVVGRNKEENKILKKLAKKSDFLIEMKNYPGPLTLIRNYRKRKIFNQILEKAKKLTQYYSPKTRKRKDIKFKIKKIESC
ncbi:tRNA 4-thiouridine(8) synthase ThiI [bacterium]|nr:tRNA 4-thiouridine(8) synthase ThiI [bacterium]